MKGFSTYSRIDHIIPLYERIPYTKKIKIWYSEQD